MMNLLVPAEEQMIPAMGLPANVVNKQNALCFNPTSFAMIHYLQTEMQISINSSNFHYSSNGQEDTKC